MGISSPVSPRHTRCVSHSSGCWSWTPPLVLFADLIGHQREIRDGSLGMSGTVTSASRTTFGRVVGAHADRLTLPLAAREPMPIVIRVVLGCRRYVLAPRLDREESFAAPLARHSNTMVRSGAESAPGAGHWQTQGPPVG